MEGLRNMEKKLYRSRKDSILGGVCGGLAEYFNLDTSLMRIIWAIAMFAGGIGFLPYIIAWIVIPEEPIGGDGSVEVIDNARGQGSMDADTTTRVIGAILVGLGTFFLFRNYLPWLRLERIWPFGFIVLGLYMLIGGKKG